MVTNDQSTDAPGGGSVDTGAGAGQTVASQPDTNKPAARTAAKKKKPADAKGGFCVYLGPSIQGVILSGTVFAADRQSAIGGLGSAIEKYPLVAGLIVSGEELPECRLNIKTPGNLLNANYEKLARELKR